jgi:hypothetical protein
MSLQADAKERNAMALSLQRSLDHVAQEVSGLQVRGLLLRGERLGDKAPENARYGRVDYLAAPAGRPYWFQEFPDLLAIVLEELAG